MGTAPPPPEQQWEALEEHFADNGFCVVRGVLAQAELEEMRAGLALDRRKHPAEWINYGQSRDGGAIGESGRWQSGNILDHATCYDRMVAHPGVLPLVRRLLGGNPCVGGVGACIRDAVLDEAPPRFGQVWPPGTAAVAPWPDQPDAPNQILWQMWHREMGGMILTTHPLCCPNVQVRFQLDGKFTQS